MNNTFEKATIGIFTNFQEFNTGYSLTGIVVDQALMLVRNGHKVVIVVNESYNSKYEHSIGLSNIRKKYPNQLKIVNKTKFMHLTDYKTRLNLSGEHRRSSIECGETFVKLIKEEGITRCYTHDFVFTGWNLPYSEAVKIASNSLKNENILWFHWIHSVPSSNSDWWNLEEYGQNHYLVFPNRTTIQQVAENFKTSPGKIMIVPHIKDIRTWYDFSDETMDFIDKYPNILDAQVVQVYPASSDRMFAKQVDSVIRIFGHIKETKCVNVFLCIANQWATGKQPRENVKEYIDLAKEHGLEYGKEFVFTSEYCTLRQDDLDIINDSVISLDMLNVIVDELKENDKLNPNYKLPEINFEIAKDDLLLQFKPYKLGINKRMLRELQLLQSVFVYPTIEESFGLVGPESAFSGALNINNRSLTMMFEIMGHMAPAFDFGSHHHNHAQAKDENYLRAVSHAILHRLLINESVQTKIHCRCRYHMDNIYRNFYLTHLL